ncbi:MAG: cupin [Clostridiaceae bacterium]|jgi:quercetin dioxygenase-like cupin family protein|uniref:cupin domain-containing protein n=1 Tax=Clostridium sp. TaxID=1506 RepID=UPI00258B5999|nr:cupin domain-containing protein [Clostridium sp.]MDF2503399.1 cupin [Clostridium sp.]MDF2882140.1 cupin [Clostridiaceae bacterium]
MTTVASGNWNELPWEEVREGITRVVFAMEADSVCCSINKVENGNEVKPHKHPNEQVALVLEGQCDYYVDGVPYRLTSGSWVTVPSNVEHYIHVYDSPVPCMNMDIFTPDRPEYTESYTKFLKENKGK